MNEIDSVIFDLDGTLWDTCQSCADAWNLVIKRNGISYRQIVADDVRRVTGKPHNVCIQETFSDLTQAQINLLIKETEVTDNEVIEQQGGDLYPGVILGLRQLAKKFPLFIVSNCPAGYIEMFIRLNGLEDIFKDHECWGNTGNVKASNISDLVERNNLKSPIYVGDTQGDADAAAACGLPFYFVEYGFGSRVIAAKSFSDISKLVRHLVR
ncbi:HAD family hydrolase [Bdellovibrio bacteriovorus]|uniref:HAD family hydrolase n=1 Tax=Bdellovibrio bacteriovorus TaxID=959 RepID=UPI003A7FAC34